VLDRYLVEFPSELQGYICYSDASKPTGSRVNRTGGNRSVNREPVRTGSGRFPTGPNSKNKKFSKILQGVKSNGVKKFQIFIHLPYFAGIRSSTSTK
jgi:hypothetical protein